ncbi:MAG: biotin transporter BioY [Chelatococcus sp.]|nr:MAG: biotin transporter BioY [Chelatococcus sp.]
MTTIALGAGFSPLNPQARSLRWQIAAVLIGTALLAFSSRITVPMLPVPMTMQTFAVTLIGALYGWRLGAITVLAWLAEGAMGLPVLANGAGGLAPFFGPTAGYLVAFVAAAALCGLLAERGWNGRSLPLAFAAMLIGNLVCLVGGGLWLTWLIGAQKALAVGVLPFVPGAVLKSALAASLLALWARRGATRSGA